MKQARAGSVRHELDSEVDYWCAEYWDVSTLLNPQQFTSRLMEMCGLMQTAMEQDDDASMIRTASRVEWLWENGKISNEGLMIAYEGAISRINLMYADYQLRQNNYEVCYRICEDVLETVKDSYIRRLDKKLPTNAFSEIKVSAFRILCECKTWGSAADVNRFIPADRLLKYIEAADHAIRQYLLQTETMTQRKVEVAEENLAWAWLAAGRMALMHVPARVDWIIEHFNSCYGPIFSADMREWASQSPMNRASVFYWEWEMAKMHAAIERCGHEAGIVPADLYYCVNQAQFAEQARQPGRVTQVAYLRRLKHEAELLARKLTVASLEVV